MSLRSIEIALLVVITPLFITSVMVNVLMEQMLQISIIANSGLAMSLINSIQGYSGALDAIVLLAFVSIVGRILIRSFLINMHPVFGMVGLIGLSAIVIVAAQVSNVAGVFMELELVSASINHFPLSFAFYQNLPAIVSVIGLLVLIVMVGTGKIGRGGAP